MDRNVVLRFCMGLNDSNAARYIARRRPESLRTAMTDLKMYHFSEHCVGDSGKQRDRVRLVETEVVNQGVKQTECDHLKQEVFKLSTDLRVNKVAMQTDLDQLKQEMTQEVSKLSTELREMFQFVKQAVGDRQTRSPYRDHPPYQGGNRLDRGRSPRRDSPAPYPRRQNGFSRSSRSPSRERESVSIVER